MYLTPRPHIGHFMLVLAHFENSRGGISIAGGYNDSNDSNGLVVRIIIMMMMRRNEAVSNAQV